MVVNLDDAKCIGCGNCVDACPNAVLEMIGKKIKILHPDDCVECGACVDACESQALTLP